MTNENLHNEEAVKAIYSKLTRAWMTFRPSYTPGFATGCMSFLTEKMTLSTEERGKWFNDELKLRSAAKGNIEYIGEPKPLAVSLITATISYGPADYLSLLHHITQAIPEQVPAGLTQDLEMVAEFYGIELETTEKLEVSQSVGQTPGH